MLGQEEVAAEGVEARQWMREHGDECNCAVTVRRRARERGDKRESAAVNETVR